MPALKKMITGKGGIVAHLHINDMKKVEELVKDGDRDATMTPRSHGLQRGQGDRLRWPGAGGKAQCHRSDGGIAYDTYFVELNRRRVEFWPS